MTVVCCQETSQHKAQQGTDMQPHCGEAGRSTGPDEGMQRRIEVMDGAWRRGRRPSIVNEGNLEAWGRVGVVGGFESG